MDSTQIMVMLAAAAVIVIGMITKKKDIPLPTSRGYKPCPKCSGIHLFKVRGTAWEGQLGPKAFKLVRCGNCRTVYNGKTGGTDIVPRILLQAAIVVMLAAALHVFIPPGKSDQAVKPGQDAKPVQAEQPGKKAPAFKIPQGTDVEKVKRGLISTAITTTQHIQVTPSSWVITMESCLGFELQMDVSRMKDMYRYDLYNGDEELAVIIVRDGFWYVREPNRPPRKYRPFQAPLRIIDFYVLQAVSEPELLTQDLVGLKLKSLEDKTAVFATPGNEYLSYDTDYGYLMNVEIPGGTASLSDFDLEPGMKESLFSTYWEEWEDHTRSMSRWKYYEKILIAHNPALEYGSKNRAVEFGIFELEKQEFHRVPFPYGRIVEAYFSAHRGSVFVVAKAQFSPGLTLYEVSLRNGETTDLIDGRLSPGIIHSAAVSSSGFVLSFMHVPGKNNMRDGQLYVYDIKKNEIEAFGPRMDASHFSWLSMDWNGVMFRKNVYTEGKANPTKVIYQYNLRDKMRKITEGDFPRYIESDKILFQGKDKLWYTCDSTGKQKKLYARGMRGYGYPALAPGQKRILWMKLKKGQWPIPMIFNLDERIGEEMTAIPGLWTKPSWK